MISVQRILPYTKQLVLYALYDVLDSEESEYDKAENGGIAAEVTEADLRCPCPNSRPLPS